MAYILTIDLEDWFHGFEFNIEKWDSYPSLVENHTLYILDLLDLYNAKATFFVLGDVANKFPNLIKEIFNRGHEIGSHGMNHKFVNSQSIEHFQHDILESIDILRNIINTPILSYRAPYFSITKDNKCVLKILRDEGILFDSSIFPGISPWHGITKTPRVPYNPIDGLLECPISTLPFLFFNLPFSGGAYLRILPSFLIKNLTKYTVNKDNYHMVYLHPYDLFPDQPRVKLKSAFWTWRRYAGLKNAETKIRTLLSKGEYTSLKNAMKNNAGYQSKMVIA